MYTYPIEMEIDGRIVRSPKVGGLTKKLEKVWSKNTGRSSSGRMQGTIKTIKRTYSIDWPPLTYDEQWLIESLINDAKKPFHTLKLRYPDGHIMELECYFGTPTFKEWEWLGGQWRCTEAKVDAIER